MSDKINYEAIHNWSQEVVNDLENNDQFGEMLNEIVGNIADTVVEHDVFARKKSVAIVKEHARETVWRAIENRNRVSVQVSDIDNAANLADEMLSNDVDPVADIEPGRDFGR